jgi:FdhE protein
MWEKLYSATHSTQLLAVACGESKPHNRPVANTPWQQRVRRAEQLAEQHPFAAEILGFYLHLAGFQQKLWQRLQSGSISVSDSSGQISTLLSDQPEFPELLNSFPQFLLLVEEKAPVSFAQTAREIRNSKAADWSELLDHCWSAKEAPAAPLEFLAFAFLQPYAEFVRCRVPLHLEGYTHSLCPFCNRKPVLGILRPQGDGGRRSLLCGFCLTEWDFRRIVCPNCGEENNAKLPVYTAESFPHIRVECCDACHTYIKSIDLTKNGLAVPLVDELASLPLDLWAQEHGYAKLHPNLFGM